MPFESKAQARFMFAKHPKMAKEWAAKTPNIKALPNRKRKANAVASRPSDAKYSMA